MDGSICMKIAVFGDRLASLVAEQAGIGQKGRPSGQLQYCCSVGVLPSIYSCFQVLAPIAFIVYLTIGEGLYARRGGAIVIFPAGELVIDVVGIPGAEEPAAGAKTRGGAAHRIMTVVTDTRVDLANIAPPAIFFSLMLIVLFPITSRTPVSRPCSVWLSKASIWLTMSAGRL